MRWITRPRKCWGSFSIGSQCERNACLRKRKTPLSCMLRCTLSVLSSLAFFNWMRLASMTIIRANSFPSGVSSLWYIKLLCLFKLIKIDLSRSSLGKGHDVKWLKYYDLSINYAVWICVWASSPFYSICWMCIGYNPSPLCWGHFTF